MSVDPGMYYSDGETWVRLGAGSPPSALPAPTVQAFLGDGRVELTWGEIDGAVSYRVYRDGTRIASPAGTGYVDTDVDNGTTYTYRVSARDASPGGEGALSIPVEATPQAALGDWETAVNSRDFAQVEAWYAANTGYTALGLSLGDLEPGSLTPTEEGQTIFARRGTSARPAVSNVTVRGCLLEWGSSLYGAYTNPTFGSPLTNIRYEYCTFIGPSEPESARRAAVVAATNDFAITFDHCDFSGGTSGVNNQGGAVIEYCWIHDLAATPEGSNVHRTSIVSTGRGCRFFRNYCTDGSSSCISLYADKREMHGNFVEENILNGSSPNASPSYLINSKSGEFGPTATDIKVNNNYWGPEFQFGILTGGNFAWGINGNERVGNEHFLTGELAGNT